VWKARLSASKPTDLENGEVWVPLPVPNSSSGDESSQQAISVLTRHYFEDADSPSQLKSKILPLDIELVENGYLKSLSKENKWSSYPASRITYDTQKNRKPLPSQAWKAGGVAGPPPRDTDIVIGNRIRWLSNFVASHSIDRIPIQSDLRIVPEWYSLKANQIGRPALFVSTISNTNGIGAPDVTYSAGPWRLEKDEALVVEGIMPPAVFGNVLMMNRHLQTIGYEFGRYQSLNRMQLQHLDPKRSVIAADGSMPYRYIVSHRDPGSEHAWLDTDGRRTGVLFYRFMLANLTVPYDLKPKTRVVTFPLSASHLEL
jgi:hypothetical protein